MEEEVCTTSTTMKQERAKLELSSSPPPNCAICLSDCDNKSFTDRCMHQFCFACLLRWSKVKAECPLCKQPFKSIIHTVRSNSDYEELVVLASPPTPEDYNHEDISVDFESHYYLPTVPQPPRQRRFQYRTTLYLDPHEDIAIQQMLMSHPLTNTLYMPRRRLTRLIGTPRPANSLDFRHAIYQHNWWVNPQSTIDFTGRYRDCSPQFFRENPAQRSRVGPWLHRELNALLNENGPHCLYVMSIINNLLLEHHVTSPEFKGRIEPYLGDKTDHFIHEFHNFLRSPYDMIGYDRNLQYTQRVQSIELESSSSSSESDSDIEVITDDPVQITLDTPSPPPRIITDPNEIIVVSDSDSNNSDVIYRVPTPPAIVTITDSDDEEHAENNVTPEAVSADNATIDESVVEYKKEEVSDSEPVRVEELQPVDLSNTGNVSNVESPSDASDYKVLVNYKLKLKKHNARRPRRVNHTYTSSDEESSSKSSSSCSSAEKRKRPLKRRRVVIKSSSDSVSFSESSCSSSKNNRRQTRATYRKKRRTQRNLPSSSSSTSSSSSSNSNDHGGNYDGNLPSTSSSSNTTHNGFTSYLTQRQRALQNAKHMSVKSSNSSSSSSTED